MKFKIVGIALLLAAIPAAVLVAQNITPPSSAPDQVRTEMRQKVREACATDVQKFCPNVERGKGGGMRSCMEAHQAQLSPGCKAARDERAAARANKS